MTATPSLCVACAENVWSQWDPEAQLVGALMHLKVDAAAAILVLVPDSANWAPDNRWAYEIIRHLVNAGADPDPSWCWTSPSFTPAPLPCRRRAGTPAKSSKTPTAALSGRTDGAARPKWRRPNGTHSSAHRDARRACRVVAAR
jgi:hypothetical protein